MKFSLIQNKAKQMGIRVYRKKKVQLIREIQEAEKNIPCYGTPRVEDCGEYACLWRNDCLACNGSAKVRG